MSSSSKTTTVTTKTSGFAPVKDPGALNGKEYNNNDQNLPSLPVPDLQGSVELYLQSVKQLVSKEQFALTTKAAEEFLQPGGVGEMLQAILQERASTHKNWLEEWWTNLAYLGYRNSLVINSNVCMSHGGRSLEQLPPHAHHQPQVAMAARLMKRIVHLKQEALDLNLLQVDVVQGYPQCMHQYPNILGSCRFPETPIDRVVNYREKARHYMVIFDEQFFVVPAYHEDGQVLNLQEFELQIERILKSPYEKFPGVGVLTTLPRDKWASVYDDLNGNPTNQHTLDILSSAIAVVCLDRERPTNHSSFLGTALHGGGTGHNTANRWFDKSYQIIVSENGNIGINVEHSVVDGLPSMRIGEVYFKPRDDELLTFPVRSSLPHPKQLPWVLSPALKREISDAAKEIDGFISTLSIQTTTFTAYGKLFVKEQKLSADGFFQMAIQLAYYLLHGHMTATYESATTRSFHHGRTETIRPTTAEALTFVEAVKSAGKEVNGRLVIPEGSSGPLASLLRAAINSHTEFAKTAMMGQSFDRHLLGLRIIAMHLAAQQPSPAVDEDQNEEDSVESNDGELDLASDGAIEETEPIDESAPSDASRLRAREDGLAGGSEQKLEATVVKSSGPSKDLRVISGPDYEGSDSENDDEDGEDNPDSNKKQATSAPKLETAIVKGSRVEKDPEVTFREELSSRRAVKGTKPSPAVGPHGIEAPFSIPALFTDPGFGIANHFCLSTSQVPASFPCYFGFGPVVQDGYGICYSINRDHEVMFSVSTFHARRDGARFSQALVDALYLLRDILSKAPQSKL